MVKPVIIVFKLLFSSNKSAKQTKSKSVNGIWHNIETQVKTSLRLQEEVIAEAGKDALHLGLLVGAESFDDRDSELFTFAHLLLQEFICSKYLATQNKVRTE